MECKAGILKLQCNQSMYSDSLSLQCNSLVCDSNNKYFIGFQPGKTVLLNAKLVALESTKVDWKSAVWLMAKQCSINADLSG